VRGFLFLVLLAPALPAQHARMASHGGSATVIETAPGRTLLLTCAHAFWDGQPKVVVLDGVPGLTQARLLAKDDDRDLALLVADAGVLSSRHVLPVAPAAHKAGRLSSAGYEGRRTVAGHWPASRAHGDALWLWTHERPMHGRSGGALYDPESRLLLGVVSGFVTDGPRAGKGVYASPESVRAFLAKHKPAPLPRMPYAGD
jgi:hypothetical protein